MTCFAAGFVTAIALAAGGVLACYLWVMFTGRID